MTSKTSAVVFIQDESSAMTQARMEEKSTAYKQSLNSDPCLSCNLFNSQSRLSELEHLNHLSPLSEIY